MAVTIEQLIEKTLAETKKEQGGLDNDKLKEVLTKVAKDGMSPKDAMGFNDNFIELIYSYAYSLYQGGKYIEAIDTFQVLRTLDLKDPRYSMGIAASFHKLKNYMNAASFYICSAVLEPSSPLPFYYASDCFLKMDNKLGSILMLKMVMQRLDKKETNTALKTRVEESIKTLEKQVAEEEKIKKD